MKPTRRQTYMMVNMTLSGLGLGFVLGHLLPAGWVAIFIGCVCCASAIVMIATPEAPSNGRRE